MARSRSSARAAGSSFERLVADGFAAEMANDNIDRKVKTGAKDQGDIGNVRHLNGDRVAVEVKEYGGRLEPAKWVKEAQQEAVNYGALCGVTVAKRRGTTDFREQWVILTVADLLALLTGEK
jgi:hypothetical protein